MHSEGRRVDLYQKIREIIQLNVSDLHYVGRTGKGRHKNTANHVTEQRSCIRSLY